MADFRVLFTAADYGRTVRFFTETMDLPVERSWDDGGGGTIVNAADGQIEILGADHDGAGGGVSGAALAWEVTDVDEAHAGLIERGATVLGSPTMQPWGHKSFSVEAPDGWNITLFEVIFPE